MQYAVWNQGGHSQTSRGVEGELRYNEEKKRVLYRAIPGKYFLSGVSFQPADAYAGQSGRV